MSQIGITEKQSFTIPQLIAATGLSRNKVYSEIARGTLRSFKVGKRRFVSAISLREFIQRCEQDTADGIAGRKAIVR